MQATLDTENYAGFGSYRVRMGGENADSYADIGTWPGEWIVVQIATQKAQFCIDNIEDTGVPVYYPKVRKRVQQGGRWRYDWRPLFYGYAFACVHDPILAPASRWDWGVMSIIRVPDCAQPQLRGEIINVQKLIAAKGDVLLADKLARGTRVRVCAGPLLGVEGIVDRYDGHHRLFVNITTLGTSASVEIDPADVEPAN